MKLRDQLALRDEVQAIVEYGAEETAEDTAAVILDAVERHLAATPSAPPLGGEPPPLTMEQWHEETVRLGRWVMRGAVPPFPPGYPPPPEGAAPTEPPNGDVCMPCSGRGGYGVRGAVTRCGFCGGTGRLLPSGGAATTTPQEPEPTWDDCVCTHAPEQHGRPGCSVVSMMGRMCPCKWDGRRRVPSGGAAPTTTK